MSKTTNGSETDAEDSPPTIEEVRQELLEEISDLAIHAAEKRSENGRGIIELEDRLDRIEDTLGTLADRLERLEEVADPDAKEYEAMNRSEKVRRLREHLVKQAQQTKRRASKLEYREVIALFDGHPSAGTAYSLMEAAGEKEGFRYSQPRNGNKRVTVDLDRLNDERLVSGGEQ